MLPISSSAAAIHQSSVSAHWDPQLVRYPLAQRLTNTFDSFQSEEAGRVEVPDPYRWLDQPTTGTDKTHTKQVEEFLSSQEALTESYLQKYSHRDYLHKVLKKTWDFPRFDSPRLSPDGYYYFRFNSGLQPQSILYRIKKGKEEEALRNLDPKKPGGEMFLDPNLFSHDGTTALSTYSFSKSGKYVAYQISPSGSDLQEIHVRRSDSPHLQSAEDGGKRGEDPGRMNDVIKNVKYGSLSWLKDDSGFFYSKYPDNTGAASDSQGEIGNAAISNHKLYFHKLGNPQSKDKLIMEDDKNPLYRWYAEVTDDGKYIIMTIRKDWSRSNLIWVADLESQRLSNKMEWKKIVNEFGNEYTFHANDDHRLYISTDKDAPHGRVVTFDLSQPGNRFEELIPQNFDAILASVHVTNNNHAVLEYTKLAKNELHLYDLRSGTRITQIGKNLIGSIDKITGSRDHEEFFFCFRDFLSPETVYRYRFDRPDGQRLVEYRRTLLSGLNADDFETKQVFYKSKDGTTVPMFIVHRKDFKQDGTAPALQYAYGGFGYSITPGFSPMFASFMAQYGGVLAVPNIRGGGEFGKAWHLAGTMENKQNVFDDFQYATKYLVSQKYAAADKVAITGTSNGGLLVAACVNQAPELYGAAIANVGLYDMLKFHRYSIGHTYMTEYGNPEEAKAFDYLKKYSPLHNINENAVYPALMLITADHDERVEPSHSFKFAAAVQQALPNNPQPCLLNIQRKTGHGPGKSTAMMIKDQSDQLAFIALSLRLKINHYSGSST